MDGMLSARPSVVLAAASDILFLKHACMPAAFSDSDVCGSRKSQASSPWTKRQKKSKLFNRNHIFTGLDLDDCLRIL